MFGGRDVRCDFYTRIPFSTHYLKYFYKNGRIYTVYQKKKYSRSFENSCKQHKVEGALLSWIIICKAFKTKSRTQLISITKKIFGRALRQTAMPQVSGSNLTLFMEFFFMKFKLNQISMTPFDPKTEWFEFHYR